MLKNYFKIAFRNTFKHKGYSFINIAGLAVGIALCLMILMFVRHELSFDEFHEKAGRIYGVTLEQGDQKIAVTPSVIAPALAQSNPEISNWVRLYEPTRYNPVIIKRGENIFQEEHFLYADSSFFDIFSFNFIAGDPASALDSPRNIVLTASSTKKLFGASNAIGKIVEARIFNEVINFTVTGIIEDVPSNSHLKFDYLASLSTRNTWSQLSDSEVRAANFYTYLLLENPEGAASLSKKIPAFIQRFISEESSISLSLIPLTDLYLSTGIQNNMGTSGSRNTIFGFSILAILILLIATTNYINLATARSSRRASEVGIRKALGAHRGELIRQFYGESVILTILSVLTAIGLVELFKEPFFNLLGLNVNLRIFGDPSTWLLLFMVAGCTALLAGSYPAILLSSFQPTQVLKGVFEAKGSGAFLRKGLVVFQFAISIFLILGTIIIYQQTDYILNKDLGFDKEQIVVLPVGDNELSQKHELLKNEILRQPGVTDATYMSNIPGRVFGGYSTEHTPNSERVSAAAGAADADVLNTLGLHLIAGQGFPSNPNYSVDQGYVFLLNETLAGAHGWKPDEAVGKDFNVLGNRKGTVVGVVEDFNFQSLKETVEPLALFIQPQMYRHLLVKINPGNIPATLSSLERLWADIAPHRPFEFEFLDEQINLLYAREIRTKNIFSIFSILAILIASLGLLGLSSYMIERRTKEIGIRKVLGASIANIVALLSTDFVKLVAIGFVIAVPIAWYAMNQWLAEFAYKIEIGVSIFLLAGGTALLIALLTVSWQSIRAAIANPVDSLKSE